MFGRVQHGGGGGGGGGGGAGVCRFYQQGRCKFGDNCKYDHPGAQRQQEPSNRYQALNNQGNNYGNNARNQQRPSAPGRGQQYTSQPAPFSVSNDAIDLDMKEDRPKWPFSAYGPGKDAPRQLFGGHPLEQSPEEMRVQYYQFSASGNMQAAVQAETEMFALASQQVQKVLGDLDGAVRYVISGRDEHPNRIDMCQGPGNQGGVFSKGRQANPAFGGSSIPNQGVTNAFSAPQPAQTSGFGAPSQTSGFGAASQPQSSAFGAPSQPQSSGFGRPSALGQSGGSGFGQASSLGARPNPFGAPSTGFGAPSSLGAKPSPFGQQAQPNAGAQSSPFGQFGQPQNQQNAGTQPSPFGAQAAQQNQPSPFGAAAQPGVSAFGQPSAPGGGSAFGQPSLPGQQGASAFGQPSAPGQRGASPFAQAPNPAAQGNAFGQPSVPNQGSAFGQPSVPNQGSAFGQPSVPNQQGGAFGRPSPFAQAASQQNGAAQASPFGQPAQTQGSAFGQPSAPNQNPSPFGQPSAPQTGAGTGAGAFGRPNPFGQTAQTQQPPSSNPFGQPAQTQPQSQPQVPPPPQQSQASTTHTPAPTLTSTGANPNPPWLTRNANSTLQTFKNRPVVYEDNVPYYRSQNGGVERIFHAQGIPANKPGVEDTEERYEEGGGMELKEVYRVVAEEGVFLGGVMPEVPPRYEWIRWDL